MVKKKKSRVREGERAGLKRIREGGGRGQFVKRGGETRITIWTGRIEKDR